MDNKTANSQKANAKTTLKNMVSVIKTIKQSGIIMLRT